ncbi:hypothetical protein AB0P17_01020 [Streptomyces sp. NPDC088124]|uniref:hypothetical protein n=1 Tax=Streptomyces sp. NPDC088124 TaxID=3154654 RepID=UPI00342B6661
MIRTADIREWRDHDVAVGKAPSIGTDDILPAQQEKAIFQHYGMTYQPRAKGERQLARR